MNTYLIIGVIWMLIEMAWVLYSCSKSEEINNAFSTGLVSNVLLLVSQAFLWPIWIALNIIVAIWFRERS